MSVLGLADLFGEDVEIHLAEAVDRHQGGLEAVGLQGVEHAAYRRVLHRRRHDPMSDLADRADTAQIARATTPSRRR